MIDTPTTEDTPAADVEARELAELSTLQASCDGPVHPGSGPHAADLLAGRWDHARERPAVVVVARCVHDVGVAVRFAARRGWGVTVVGPTSIWRRSETDPTVAVVVDRLRTLDVEIARPFGLEDGRTATGPDGARGWTARVGAATTYEDLRRHLAECGAEAFDLGAASGTVGQLTDTDTVDGHVGVPAAAHLVSSVQVVDGSGRSRWVTVADGATWPDPSWIVTAVELRSPPRPR